MARNARKTVKPDDSIIIETPRDTVAPLEDESEFPQFLDFLAQSALAHPDRLVALTARVAGGDDLFAGVEPDIDLER